MKGTFISDFEELEKQDFKNVITEKEMIKFLKKFNTVDERIEFLEYFQDRMNSNQIFLHPDDPELAQANFVPYLARFENFDDILHLNNIVIPKILSFIEEDYKQPNDRFLFLRLKRKYRMTSGLIEKVVQILLNNEVFVDGTSIEDVLKVFRTFERVSVPAVKIGIDYRKLQLVLDEVFTDIFDGLDLQKIERSERFVMLDNHKFKANNIYKHRKVFLEYDSREKQPAKHIENKEFMSALKKEIAKVLHN